MMWKLFVGLAVATLLVFWFLVVHQDDEILALTRNEVVSDTSGRKSWAGRFVNTNDRSLQDVSVEVDFLDQQGRAVGRAHAEAGELPHGSGVDLQAQLPANAARIRIHSVRWRMGGKSVQIGQFREPWDFGYLMVDP